MDLSHPHPSVALRRRKTPGVAARGLRGNGAGEETRTLHHGYATSLILMAKKSLSPSNTQIHTHPALTPGGKRETRIGSVSKGFAVAPIFVNVGTVPAVGCRFLAVRARFAAPSPRWSACGELRRPWDAGQRPHLDWAVVRNRDVVLATEFSRQTDM